MRGIRKRYWLGALVVLALLMGAECGAGDGGVKHDGPPNPPRRIVGHITIQFKTNADKMHVDVRASSPDGRINETFNKDVSIVDYVQILDYDAGANVTVVAKATIKTSRVKRWVEGWIYDSQKPGTQSHIPQTFIEQGSRTITVKYTRIVP